MARNLEIRVLVEVIRGTRVKTIDLVVERIDQQESSSTFESILKVSGQTEKAMWNTNDTRLLEAYFTQYMQKLLSQNDPQKDAIEIIEDSKHLLSLKSAHCQHCGKKLFETFGVAYGVIKKCPNCGRLSFYRE